MALKARIGDSVRGRTIRNLAIFTAVALGIGGVGRFLDVVSGRPSTEGPGILLWLVIPAGAAVCLRTFAGDGGADSGMTPNVRGNVRWYIVALLVYPVLTAAIVTIGALLGLTSIAGLSWAVISAVLHTSALGLGPQVLKNVFEETAWRGYLAPKVYGLGWNDYAGHAAVGLVWGAWHIPYYLYFLDRGVLEEFTDLPLAAFIVAAIVVMVYDHQHRVVRGAGCRSQPLPNGTPDRSLVNAERRIDLALRLDRVGVGVRGAGHIEAPPDAPELRTNGTAAADLNATNFSALTAASTV